MEAFVNDWILQGGVWAPAVFVFARALAIAVPPIPGILIDTAGLALFPWWAGFLLAETGIMLGGIVAFYLARFIREPLVRHIAPLKKVEEWENQYSEKQKLFTLIAVRFFSASAFDYISYAAGLTKISFATFFLSSLVGSIPAMFMFYVLGGALTKFLGTEAVLVLGLAVTAIVLFNLGKIGEAVKVFTDPSASKDNTDAHESAVDTKSAAR